MSTVRTWFLLLHTPEAAVTLYFHKLSQNQDTLLVGGAVNINNIIKYCRYMKLKIAPAGCRCRPGFDKDPLFYRTWMWRGMVCRVLRHLSSLTRPWLWRTRPSEPSPRLPWTSWLGNTQTRRTWTPQDRSCRRETWTPSWLTRFILVRGFSRPEYPESLISMMAPKRCDEFYSFTGSLWRWSNKSCNISFTAYQIVWWLTERSVEV